MIDHHSIDAFLSARGVRREKCATKMVADYSDTVLTTIQAHQIKKTETHFDSDLDAVCASYLVKSIVDNGKLPSIGAVLAEIVNKVDYGRIMELGGQYLDPEQIVNTLPFLFESIKSECIKRRQAEAVGGVVTPELRAKYEILSNKSMFGVLNVADEQPEGSLNLAGDVSGLIKLVAPDVRELILAGQKTIQESYRKFVRDLGGATKDRIVVPTKDGNRANAELLIAKSNNPMLFLKFNNMARKTAGAEGDQVVALYSGLGGDSGSNYVVAITPEQAEQMDLRPVCLALNRMEKQKRQAIYDKQEAERSDDEKNLVAVWEKQKREGKQREAFSGIRDQFAAGKIKESDFLDIDPSPMVSGGSLVPASRTSLLTYEDFIRVLDELKI